MDSTKLHPYLVYDTRLASFQKSSKKRGSSASGRAKAAAVWPHKQIAPASLAKAGFYFNPTPASPDNVVCFLCGKGLDGWEAGDDPLLEHLKHAPDCGWATVAAIEADVGDYGAQDPVSQHMTEARKATFGDWWPHQGKKGWKCKTKQLAEAGWKYTPTADSDDMATCAYCQLALDGWEPSDKPYEEHYNRSPDCAFFSLVNQFGGAKKRTARAKAGRGSKASRVSAQSTTSDRLSGADTTAGADDSLLSTTSIMTQGGKKVRGKKVAGAKANRSKATKDEAEAEEEEEVSQPKATKATRGRKRGSEALDDSLLAPPKRRATRTRSSTITAVATYEGESTDRKAAGRKGLKTARTSDTSRHPSVVSSASVASLRRGPATQFPYDDDEIERQLEADLERDWDDDGDEPRKDDDFAMLDPCPVADDDEAVEEELRALQEEMRMEEPEQQLKMPKKGRKPNKQAQSKPSRTKTASPAREVEETGDVSVGSTDTVVKKDSKRGRGRQSKRSSAAEQAVEQPARGRRSKEKRSGSASAVQEPMESDEARAEAEGGQSGGIEDGEAAEGQQVADGAEGTSTPAPPAISPAPSARQPALSPSPSPQSSDAENQPPSSRANKAVAAGPTPARDMATRNILAGLQTTAPWTAASLEELLTVTADDEDGALLPDGRLLSTPEKAMTVEEWIYFNAGRAEERLRLECEAMVSRFEREGTRAMRALEGLAVE
ncbi:hypothetical protein CDD80_6170 [Ophiocordyceps camponoti-rufipedis]|uniref:BIR-domain-containing protein n=1 Tax=Ophiocordyceps camponoti-rufipedis TaxID=2004952 RepID=A0A2C5YR44_9HYPO|nr:hypothetical protein CDD80_6170 [Ophiocordyceps camponoti-rufipedis]